MIQGGDFTKGDGTGGMYKILDPFNDLNSFNNLDPSVIL